MSKTLACTHYSTSKTLDELWAYYAPKLGMADRDSPSGSYTTTTAGPGGTVEIMILSTKGNGDATRAATLIRRTEGQTVTIHLSRVAPDAGTLVSVFAETR